MLRLLFLLLVLFAIVAEKLAVEEQALSTVLVFLTCAAAVVRPAAVSTSCARVRGGLQPPPITDNASFGSTFCRLPVAAVVRFVYCRSNVDLFPSSHVMILQTSALIWMRHSLCLASKPQCLNEQRRARKKKKLGVPYSSLVVFSWRN